MTDALVEGNIFQPERATVLHVVQKHCRAQWGSYSHSRSHARTVCYLRTPNGNIVRQVDYAYPASRFLFWMIEAPTTTTESELIFPTGGGSSHKAAAVKRLLEDDGSLGASEAATILGLEIAEL